MLHEAIEATFRERIPAFKHVEPYPELNKEMGEPALVFAVTGTQLLHSTRQVRVF